MRYALINPRWSFDGSIYFGCREPHLPLEYGYSKALLEAAGHEVEIVDAQLDDLDEAEVHRRVAASNPDFTVVCTAPSYLFWRCAPPELRVPIATIRAVRDVGGTIVGVGPHASTTPRTALRKLGADVVVIGECEEILPLLARKSDWSRVPSIAYWKDAHRRSRTDEIVVQGTPHGADLTSLPALAWDDRTIARHGHHHHRFDRPAARPGAELEASRGCPYKCTFCAKENFRDRYRKRPLETVLAEIDRFVAQGVEYVYFVDEIFMPDEPLLEALVERPIEFGVQMRIDLWSKPQLDLLGRAGCVSIEAGVESVTPESRIYLAKRCRSSTEELEDLLIHAKKSVPFVQANLLEMPHDDPEGIDRFRGRLRAAGVWANDPVPLFPYPGSPDYRRLLGPVDDDAWDRAIDWYLEKYASFSEIQESRPRRLIELEATP
jgi:B12-binding domain/radical SAM domain protein of rhizo-twelve system